jgi:regulatory protein
MTGPGSEEREADAWRRAVRILSHRDHSVEEIRRKLGQRGFVPEEVDAVVARLRRAGFLDDVRFAEAFVRERVLRRPMGRRGLLRELGRRGVSEEAAGAAIRAVWEEEGVDEAELVRRVLRRGSVVRDVRALLRRRGFDGDVVRMVLAERDDRR